GRRRSSGPARSSPGLPLSSPYEPVLGYRLSQATARSRPPCPTMLPHAARNSSTSASVVVHPRLTRMADRATSSGKPIAVSTGLTPTLPDEHAAPALMATPAKSNRITSVSADRPGSARHVVLGRRSAPDPIASASGAMAKAPD